MLTAIPAQPRTDPIQLSKADLVTLAKNLEKAATNRAEKGGMHATKAVNPLSSPAKEQPAKRGKTSKK